VRVLAASRAESANRSTSLATYVFAGRYFLRGLMAGSVKG